MSRLSSGQGHRGSPVSSEGGCLMSDVFDVLESLWEQEANPRVSAFTEPLDGLMLTVLSQNTNDNNRDRAFKELKSRFPGWVDVAMAPLEDLAMSIKVAGIRNVKSARMKEILAIIKDSFGGYSLKALNQWKKEDVEAFLVGLPGVGPKTAACVMAFDLGIPAFPVDTHVARFCRRMGWVEEKTSPGDIQLAMEDLVPEVRKKGSHLNIISHCKAICRARNPLCDSCAISRCCPWFSSQ